MARIGNDGTLISVWDGVPAPNGGLGGRLVFDLDGSLVIGLGNGTNLERYGLSGGAMLRLDPDAEADQQPEIISTGWNNPFAFAGVDCFTCDDGDDGRASYTATIADDCRLDVIDLPDGSVAYSTGESIKTVDRTG